MVLVHRQAGQASVELVAAIPLIAIVLLCGWQVVVAGHTWWKVQEAARLAARADYVARQRGEEAAGRRRGREVVRDLLASTPEGSRRLTSRDDGAVTVTARVPLVTPFKEVLGASGGPRVTATSRMRP